VKKVIRLRPKRHDQICESIQLILDTRLDLPQETRDSLANTLGQLSPPKGWLFFMLNPDQVRFVSKAIGKCPRPLSTFKVWTTASTYIQYDTGEIMAGRKLLAEETELSPGEISRALAQLADIGALVRLRRGRYAVNPYVGWAGSLYNREAVAKETPSLKLVDRDGAP
jgi:hypothetical protein